MAIPISGKLKPKGVGGFALVDAEDVELNDGRRLDKVLEAIGYSDDEFTALFENVTPTFTDSEGTGVFTGTIKFGDNLTVGAIYKVLWGDTEHICKCFDTAEGGGAILSGAFLGNANIAFDGAYDTKEPFFFVPNPPYGAMVVLTKEEGETHTISLYQLIEAPKLPIVSEADNGKVLKVEDGQWQAATGGAGGGFVAQPEPPEDTSLLWIDTDDESGKQVYTKAEVDEKLKAYPTTKEATAILQGYTTKEEIEKVLGLVDGALQNYVTTETFETSMAQAMALLQNYATTEYVNNMFGAYITDIDNLVGGDA